MKPASTALLGSDTAVDAQLLQIDLWRAMSPLEKAQAVARISRNVRELSLAGIQQRHPSASARECHLRYALLTLGSELACRAYPDAADLLGR